MNQRIDVHAVGNAITGLGDLFVHTIAFVTVFWTLVILSEFSNGLVVFGSWLYLLALYWHKVGRYSGSESFREDGQSTRHGRIGLSLKWLAGFPVSILVVNILCLRVLAALVTTDGVNSLPIFRTLAAAWSWLYVSGLSALITYTAAASLVAGIGFLALNSVFKKLRNVTKTSVEDD